MDAYKYFQLKKEVTYGTDAVPTAVLNGVLSRNFTSNPAQVDQLDRNLDLPSRGRSASKPSAERKTISYELELAGSGAAGTAAPWMEHLECCGMSAPTLTAGTKAEQIFASATATLSSGTIYDWVGTQKSVGTGARGSFSWDFTAGAYPFLKFTMLALIAAGSPAVTSAAPTASTIARWKDPVEVNDANTDFTLDGYAAVLKSFTGDTNADVKLRNLVGARYINRGNHAITGNIVIEAPDPTAKDYFASLRTGANVAFLLTHGIVAGNIVEFLSSNLQILNIDGSEEDGKWMFNIQYGLNISAGQDDLTIRAK